MSKQPKQKIFGPNDNPESIADMKAMIEQGVVEPISEEERERLQLTIAQQTDPANNKKVLLGDLNNQELLNHQQDCLDTLKYVTNNKASFGIMYDYALSITKTLLKEANQEIDKRGILK